MDQTSGELQPYQQRVIQEQRELDEKIGKLEAFTKSPAAQHISLAEWRRLRIQLSVMKTYSEILGQRIAIFSGGVE